MTRPRQRERNHRIGPSLRRLEKKIFSEYAYFNVLAVLTGIACGLIAIGFRYVLAALDISFYSWISGDMLFFTVFIPALGGLIVGLITSYAAPEARGHGVPEVMAAVAVSEGKIRGRVVLAKAVASAICIGSGGSAGREGPIVQVGSAFGSTAAQRLGLTPYHRKILLACGAAGGISATFNTPISGVLFALELILVEFKTRSFIPLVISSVFGSLTSRVLLGNELAFVNIPEYTLVHPVELAFYLVLGLVCGLVAIFYIICLDSFEDFFDRLRAPGWFKPAIGGLAVGAIALLVPNIRGVGYETVETSLQDGLVFELMFALIFLKIVATALTLGSGGSGGVFAPGLFIGAMTGGTVGYIFHSLFPALTATPHAYALVGMAALFAGASRATLTAIIILFEMTGNYAIILPLMFACVVSDGVGAFGFRDSIYTIKLRRKGIRVHLEHDVDIMETVCVKDAMTEDVLSVDEDMTMAHLSRMIQFTGHMGFPVLDRSKRLIGIVTHSDVKMAMLRGESDLRVKDIETTRLVTVFADDTLHDALVKVGGKGISHLPVVTHQDPQRLVGFLTKGDIMRVYRKRMMEEMYMEHHLKLRGRGKRPSCES